MNRNPYFNLAAEEYFLTHLECEKQDHVFIYINRPAVVLGRNQNIYEEVNLTYCHENKIDICRRISGGGTVYHDEGNINICWFSKSEMHKVNNYTNFMSPLIAFLKTYQIDSYLNKRNSLYLGDKKIGGNAQFSSKKNLLSHCTLLFDSSLNHLEKAITPSFQNIQSHAGKSVRSEVMNIKTLLSDDVSIEIFISSMKQYFMKEGIKIVLIDENMSDYVQRNNEAKLKSFEWVYARSPKCEIEIEWGQQKFIILVNKGMIEAIQGTNIPDSLQNLIAKPFMYQCEQLLLKADKGR